MSRGALTGAHETLLKHHKLFGPAKVWVEAGRSLIRIKALIANPKMTKREWQLSGMSEKDKTRGEAADAARKAAKESGLPALAGTAKRKTWGEQIRADFVKENAGAADLLRKLTQEEPRFADAAFWIYN
jgi:hypothetical protein